MALKKKLKESNAFSRAHRYDLYEYRHKEDYLPMREYLLDNLDYVFPCSDDGTKYLKEKYSSFSEKINTSYLGSPDQGVNYSSKGKPSFIIVSCSRIAPVKRVDKILEVITLLLQMELDVPIQWIHIGAGKDFRKITKQAKGLIDRDKAVFLGNISNKDVLDFYTRQHVDLFINLSDSEGLPISIMEASSFGIPIFATDVGGTNEIVENGVNGWLINHNSNAIQTAKQLKDIICVLRNTDESLKYRTNARNIWKEKFLVKKNTEKMISVVEKK